MAPGVAVCESRVSAVGLRTQELLADQRVENRAARLLLDSAKTMHLFGRETQTGHFEEFGAETLEGRLHMTSLSDQRQGRESHSKPRRRCEARVMWRIPARRRFPTAASPRRPLS